MTGCVDSAGKCKHSEEISYGNDDQSKVGFEKVWFCVWHGLCEATGEAQSAPASLDEGVACGTSNLTDEMTN